MIQRLGRWAARPLFWLVLAAIFYTPFIDTDPGQGNVASDLAAIESLVERHTFFINDSAFFNTIDKFKRGDLYFSQKSPIFHLVAAIPYAALKAMGFTLRSDQTLCLRVLTLFLTILPMGWLLYLIYTHPWITQRSPQIRLLLTLGFLFGSLLTPFAVTLNHYIPAAAFMLKAVNVLSLNSEPKNSLSKNGASVGFWISASLASDIPPAFIFLCCLILAWLLMALKNPTLWPRIAGLAMGSAPIFFLYASLNLHIIGSPLPPNLHEKEMLYFPGSYWSEVQAKADRGEPGYYQASYLRRLVHSTVGHKGIYWMMPTLLLASFAGIKVVRRRDPDWPLALAWILFPLVTIAIVMRWAFDLSGGAYGIRHCFATIPPLYCVLGKAGWLDRRRLPTFATIAGTLWGCLIAAIGMINPWSHNTLSAFPPLENLARLYLGHERVMPTGWIESVIRSTSVEPATAWLDLGLEYLRCGELGGAERVLGLAIKTDPRVAIAYYHLGIVQDMRRKPTHAIATYQILLGLEPGNVGAWNNLGIFSLHAGDLDRAEGAFKKSLELAPENATGMLGMLLLDQQKGKADSNSPKLRAALARHPQDARIRRLAQDWGMKLD